MYYFIINPHSRSGKTSLIWHDLETVLIHRQISYKSFFTNYAGHAVKISREICKRTSEKKTIVIVGGDGSVNEVINGLPSYKNITIGYIPTGSGNDLARGLGISIQPMEALENILQPKKYYYTDTGIITMYCKNQKSQRKFVVSSGIGYDACVCERALTSNLKKILNKMSLGKLSYLMLGIWQVLVNQSSDAEILIDGITQKKLKQVFFIASMIQKSEGGGLKMTPTAKNDDQLLTLCVVSGISKARVFYTIPFLFFGKHVNMKGIEIITCKNVKIKTSSPMTVHTDGEIPGKHTQIELTCTKDKLRFIV